MNQVFLLLGGNLEDRLALLNAAKETISKEIGAIVQESSIYETAPWGFESEQDFLNQVIIVSTALLPIEILEKCQIIEKNLGRIRQTEQYASRKMDIDILFYDDEIINIPDLIIPHKQLHKRKFTLEPLVEIAPNFLHPLMNRTLTEILKNCNDNSSVKRL
jgi:2-amino-4-hydroxy-6-hydroxymethyldihydropteridine diphosphokinase